VFEAVNEIDSGGCFRVIDFGGAVDLFDIGRYGLSFKELRARQPRGLPIMLASGDTVCKSKSVRAQRSCGGAQCSNIPSNIDEDHLRNHGLLWDSKGCLEPDE
jgi:hypothetical protein